MSLAPGSELSLAIEKPAVGGRMIARADGQVVLVIGAIPGERVRARVERLAGGVVYAHAIDIEEPSADRVDPLMDAWCGGCLYAHIAYERQRLIKSQVIADAFARIGRITLPAEIDVAPSRIDGYRMRARLHVRGDRFGFFREGTHDLCDARATRQLSEGACAALDRVWQKVRDQGPGDLREVELAESADGRTRVVHLRVSSPHAIDRLAGLSGDDNVTGITASGEETPAPLRIVELSGSPYVEDAISIGEQTLRLRRHVLAFFQGNRYLLNHLVAQVVDQIPAGTTVVDLYAGTGVFSLAAAAARGARVTAIEGDPISARDLAANAAASSRVRAIHQSVESFVARRQPAPDVLIVDPPRTGMSREALQGAIALRAPRVVYVSCDVATLARDARRLLDAGYSIERVDAFDLFPNTPHVETVMVLTT